MTNRPLWLESPDVLQLLGLLVDRLDAADLRGTGAQSVALTEKTAWPAGSWRSVFKNTPPITRSSMGIQALTARGSRKSNKCSK